MRRNGTSTQQAYNNTQDRADNISKIMKGDNKVMVGSKPYENLPDPLTCQGECCSRRRISSETRAQSGEYLEFEENAIDETKSIPNWINAEYRPGESLRSESDTTPGHGIASQQSMDEQSNTDMNRKPSLASVSMQEKCIDRIDHGIPGNHDCVATQTAEVQHLPPRQTAVARSELVANMKSQTIPKTLTSVCGGPEGAINPGGVEDKDETLLKPVYTTQTVDQIIRGQSETEPAPIRRRNRKANPMNIQLKFLTEEEQQCFNSATEIARTAKEAHILKALSSMMNHLKLNSVRQFGHSPEASQGCVLLKFLVNSVDILDNYQRWDMIKLLEVELQQMLKKDDSLRDVNTSIDKMRLFLNQSDLNRLKSFYAADTLLELVDFAYCAEEEYWYWSPDGRHWMRDDIFVVQAGEHKGKKPREEDLDRLEKLWDCQPPATAGLCFICNLKEHNADLIFREDTRWTKESFEETTAIDSNDEDGVRQRYLKEIPEQANSLSPLEAPPVQLEVIVAGHSGSGKSSFINATFGHYAHADGSALRWQEENTPQPRRYTSKEYSGIVLHEFPTIEHLESMSLSRYHVCLFLCNGPLSESDVQALLGVRRFVTNIYLVHTKVDKSIGLSPTSNQRTSLVAQHEKQLLDLQLSPQDVYLLSCVPRRNIQHLDWSRLIQTFCGIIGHMVSESRREVKTNQIEEDTIFDLKKADPKDVLIIYSDLDCGKWSEYIRDEITRVGVNPRRIKDRSLFEDLGQSSALDFHVFLVLMSPAHIEYLKSSSCATYESFIPKGESGIILFLNTELNELNKFSLCDKFSDLENWTKLQYTGGNTISDLSLKVVEKIKCSKLRHSRFSVNPTTINTQGDTEIALMLDNPVSETSTVNGIIKNSTGVTERTIRAARVNPHCYSITMPAMEECDVSVGVEVDGYSFGSENTVTYKSYMTTKDVVAVNELYCECMDTLASIVVNREPAEDIDKRLAEVLSEENLQSLNCVYQYYNKVSCRAELPTLAHFAAKYNLMETTSSLHEETHMTQACLIPNKYEQTPLDIAEGMGNMKLSSMIREKIVYYATIYPGHVTGSHNLTPQQVLGTDGDEASGYEGIDDWEVQKTDDILGKELDALYDKRKKTSDPTEDRERGDTQRPNLSDSNQGLAKLEKVERVKEATIEKVKLKNPLQSEQLGYNVGGAVTAERRSSGAGQRDSGISLASSASRSRKGSLRDSGISLASSASSTSGLERTASWTKGWRKMFPPSQETEESLDPTPPSPKLPVRDTEVTSIQRPPPKPCRNVETIHHAGHAVTSSRSSKTMDSPVSQTPPVPCRSPAPPPRSSKSPSSWITDKTTSVEQSRYVAPPSGLSTSAPSTQQIPQHLSPVEEEIPEILHNFERNVETIHHAGHAVTSSRSSKTMDFQVLQTPPIPCRSNTPPPRPRKSPSSWITDKTTYVEQSPYVAPPSGLSTSAPSTKQIPQHLSPVEEEIPEILLNFEVG